MSPFTTSTMYHVPPPRTTTMTYHLPPISASKEGPRRPPRPPLRPPLQPQRRQQQGKQGLETHVSSPIGNFFKYNIILHRHTRYVFPFLFSFYY